MHANNFFLDPQRDGICKIMRAQIITSDLLPLAIQKRLVGDDIDDRISHNAAASAVSTSDESSNDESDGR